MSIAEFAYAQARLQARHGSRADDATWRALEASHTAAHYLAMARSGPLAAWIEGLDESGDAHRIERHLLTRWRRRVDEIAGWLPARWRPALRWFGTLATLPQVDPARSGERAVAEWLERWRDLLPPDAGDRALVQRPAVLLLPRLAGPGAGRPAADESGRHALLALFRRHAGSAVAVFAYLALAALDLERLRGDLVVRVLLEPAASAPEA